MEFKLNRTQLIGLFVIITIVAIYFVINFLKGEDVFKKRVSYYAVFENVEGLTPTSPVFIRGLKVGSVEKIKYDNSNWNFIVKLSVKDYYNVPSNSTVEIYSTDILGGKSIRISLGDAVSFAKSNDTLRSNTVPDMLTVFQREMGPMKDQISSLLSNMNEVLLKINGILDAKAQDDIASILDNLKKTLKNTTDISGNINRLSPEISGILENLDVLSQNLKTGSEDLNATLNNANKISAGLSEADLKGTIENLKTALEKLQDPNGTIGKMMRTDSLHNSIEDLVNNANNLIKKISDNPKKYIRISVF